MTKIYLKSQNNLNIQATYSKIYQAMIFLKFRILLAYQNLNLKTMKKYGMPHKQKSRQVIRPIGLMQVPGMQEEQSPHQILTGIET